MAKVFECQSCGTVSYQDVRMIKTGIFWDSYTIDSDGEDIDRQSTNGEVENIEFEHFPCGDNVRELYV